MNENSATPARLILQSRQPRRRQQQQKQRHRRLCPSAASRSNTMGAVATLLLLCLAQASRIIAVMGQDATQKIIIGTTTTMTKITNNRLRGVGRELSSHAKKGVELEETTAIIQAENNKRKDANQAMKKAKSQKKQLGEQQQQQPQPLNGMLPSILVPNNTQLTKTTTTSSTTTSSTTTTKKDFPNNMIPNMGTLPIKCTLDMKSFTTISSCPTDQFCQVETGVCTTTTTTTDINTEPTSIQLLAGICQPLPQLCTSMYDPVCGCDGKTYGSVCAAHGVGMSVSYIGECVPITTTTTTTTIKPTTLGNNDNKEENEKVLYNMFEGPCASDAQCAGGLVCHTSSSMCVCNEFTNEGCPISGQICTIPPGMYCSGGGGGGGEGCLPTCSCDYTSPFPAIYTSSDTMEEEDASSSSSSSATSNGCEVGEVCRMPCAMADAGPTCFTSDEERDCRAGHVCIDGNGDGIINENDGGMGCIEAVTTTMTTQVVPAATLATIGTPPVQTLPCRLSGQCRSPSGVCEPRVECISDPCLMADCAANYVCEANYCGGCHANCVLADS